MCQAKLRSHSTLTVRPVHSAYENNIPLWDPCVLAKLTCSVEPVLNFLLHRSTRMNLADQERILCPENTCNSLHSIKCPRCLRTAIPVSCYVEVWISIADDHTSNVNANPGSFAMHRRRRRHPMHWCRAVICPTLLLLLPLPSQQILQSDIFVI